MADSPYNVVASPNYASPLLNFSVLSGQQHPQQQQPQGQGQGQPAAQGQQQNPNNPFQKLGSSINNFAHGLSQYLQPAQQPVGMPMNISPGSIAGANNMTSGLY
jgi:hypothetical protein